MPPNLDQSRSSRLEGANLRLDRMLELLTGVSCILDPDGAIRATSENWDELLARTGRTELLRNAVLGSGFLELLPAEEEVRTSFSFALATLADGRQKQLTQTVDYGAGGKPLTVNYMIRALREEGKLSGYLVQGLDVTHEAVIRVALLDRDRKLRELKGISERQAADLARMKKQMESKVAGHDQAVMAALKAFQRAPGSFENGLCELAAEASGAMFATLLIFSPTENRFHLTAQHNAPEYHRFAVDADVLDFAPGEGPAGIAAENGCATKFDHLLEREDFAKWAPLAEQNGYHCIWALPLESEEGIFGVLQLYFAEQDKALTVEQCGRLASYCQTAVPLLKVSEQMQEKGSAPRAENFRALASELSEEFGNLLTGVLGHSSLAAAEIGEGHSAVNDLNAIELAAREAARLTRRLSAISGATRRAGPPLDLAGYVRQYAEREKLGELTVQGEPCGVRVDTASVDVILDGMAAHARMATTDGTPSWTLLAGGDGIMLTLTYRGSALAPSGWTKGGVPTQAHAQIAELVFAREAARVCGGEIALDEKDGMTAVTLTLPLAKEMAHA